MEIPFKLRAADSGRLLATSFREVDFSDPASCEAAAQWWVESTAAGNNGMGGRPPNYIGKERLGIPQSSIKCHGSEYLRIIDGAEYPLPGNLGLASSLQRRGQALVGGLRICITH
jgi:hypothetical protein